MERRNAWLSYTEAEEKELEQVAKAYRNFLNVGKTERECVTQIIREAQASGYESLEEKTAKGEKLKAGDKVYTVGMKKIIALFHIGQDDISEGMNILGAHIDSPRLDVKQNPLYEDTDLAYLDTHYYGGVKKYQWVTLPLAIHGVVVKKDGSTAEVNIGEDEDDPIVYITDLLIHLAGKQMQKKAAEVIEGENLDILIGSRPLKDLEDDKKKEAVKQKRRLQRSISRSYEKNKKGESYCKTNNVIKKEKLLLKRNHRLTNIRKNHLNQTISEIVDRKPRFICIEDLNVSGMMKNRHLSKAVQEQGFFWFRKQLEYKCNDKGIQLIVADRFYPSSKLCSCCGNIKKDLKLSDRVYRCECGNMIDRDFQASINLKAYGERVAS